MTMSLIDVAEKLSVHYMTVYRYVRTGRLAATKVGGEWRVTEEDLESFSSRAAQPRPTRAVGRTGRRRSLEARLIAGDEPGSWSIIEGALGSGSEVQDVYHHLLIPAMQSIGRRWAAREISVIDEHMATSVANRLISRLGPQMRSRGRTRGTVILGAPSDDHHALPTAMLSDLLRSIRYDVMDLGAHTPAESFLEAMRRGDRVVAVGISCSTTDNEATIRSLIAAIRAQEPSIPVLLGGTAVRDKKHAEELGANSFASRSAEVLELFESVIASAV